MRATQVPRRTHLPSVAMHEPPLTTRAFAPQIVELGDPLRRGCDQSESVGANFKSTIHRRVARNRITGKAVKHQRRDAHGRITKEWTQKALKVSRIMQAFRAECVREKIVRATRGARNTCSASTTACCTAGARARRAKARAARQERAACRARSPRACASCSRRAGWRQRRRRHEPRMMDAMDSMMDGSPAGWRLWLSGALLWLLVDAERAYSVRATRYTRKSGRKRI